MVIYFGFPASVLIKAGRLVRIKQIKNPARRSPDSLCREKQKYGIFV